MRLEVLRTRARVLCAAAICAAAAACADSNPGGPQTGSITVTAISPSTGTTFGGTAVTISGTGFASGATVTIGGVAATDVVVASATRITAKTPAHAAGVGEVRVTVGTKSGSLASGFNFTVPSPSTNTAPVVSSITVQPPRPDQPASLASTGDRVSLTVSVNDAETPASQLTYQWTTVPSSGTFTGSGPAVQWTAPSTITVPQVIALTLTVIERYQEAGAQGLPVEREHRVQRTASVKVHNTVKEVSDMAVDFLTLFSNSSLPPEPVLHNFSRTCDDGEGYRQEYNDIVTHRSNVVVLSHTITPPTFFEYEFGADNACSRTTKSTFGDVCVEVPITWVDRNVGSTVANPPISGVDFVTAVYENAQWRLCHSRFDGVNTLTGKPVNLDVTPRRRIIKGPKDK